MYQNTKDLRAAMTRVLHDLEAGRISNTCARARVTAAKAILETLKVEIAAASLGRPFAAVEFDRDQRVVPLDRAA